MKQKNNKKREGKQIKTEKKNTMKKNPRFRNNIISVFGLCSGVITLASSPDIGI
jgi:hypothetical protein